MMDQTIVITDTLSLNPVFSVDEAILWDQDSETQQRINRTSRPHQRTEIEGHRSLWKNGW